MSQQRLYPDWEEVSFVRRKNRFVMSLSRGGKPFDAHIANSGRMIEYCIPGHRFYITEAATPGKYRYRVIGTRYQNSYILLDTIRYNRLVAHILGNRLIPRLAGTTSFKREVSLERSKFDFLIEREGEKPAILEVKSSTLCHNGMAMFPDAPTSRGKRHLEDLEKLGKKDYDTFVLYLISHRGAQVFSPNFHTDPEYAAQFSRSGQVRYLAYKLYLTDPVTIDWTKLAPVRIDHGFLQKHNHDRGAYLLLLNNPSDFSKKIGRLGTRTFRKGYYVYVGSAMNGLKARIKRHRRKQKKIHWHIDYVTPDPMTVTRTFDIRRDAPALEQKLAEKMVSICETGILGFGATDSPADSHLFYFPEDPMILRRFIDLLLDFRMIDE